MSRIIFLLFLSTVAFQHVDAQERLVDSLKRTLIGAKVDSVYIKTLAVISQNYRGKDNDQAIFYSKEILRFPDVKPNQTGKAFVALGLIYADQGTSLDSAFYFFEKAGEIARKYPNDTNLQSVYYNGLGLFYKKQGNNLKALEYYVIVDKIGEAGLGIENLAGNQLNISNTYSRMGNRREAIRYLYKALPVFESRKNVKGMSYCYNNLGLLLKQTGELKDSEVYLLKSLRLKEQEGDTKGIANSCNELALLYMESSELTKANLYIDRTIELSEKLGSQELLATGLVNKGKILRAENKLDEATLMFQKAQPLAEALANHFLLSFLHAEMGKVSTDKKENDKAIKQLLSGIAEAEKSSNVDALLNAHLFLSQAYFQSKKYKEAFEQLEKYHNLEDSVQGRKLKLDFKTLETQYEVEKKNTEIALLKKDQELQTKTAERQRAIQTGIGIALLSVIIISALLINRFRIVNRTKRLLEIERVRNTIARDLHDDIGSTMSSINIVSQLALKQNGSNALAGDHFGKIAEQSAAIMERMSDIVWSINPVNDSLPAMAAKMKEFTAEILEPKNIAFNFSGIESLNGEILEVEKRKNIFLIFKEAVNNAAKYSEGSAVNIRFMQKNKMLHLEIADNGKGFDKDVARKGNGLRNMEERAKSMNGAFRIQSTPSGGTSVHLDVSVT